MSLSPDGSLLAAIHFSGKLSIWAVPSLKQQGVWSQEEQVRLLLEPLLGCGLAVGIHIVDAF